MKVDGSCHCGRVRFEARIDPQQVGICHCTDCQSLSGTAFRVSAPAAEADFKLHGEKPKTYVKTAESGRLRLQAFCGECGAQIYATSVDGDDRVFNVRVGTLRQRAELVPTRQHWCRSKLPWLPELPGEQSQGQSGVSR